MAMMIMAIRLILKLISAQMSALVSIWVAPLWHCANIHYILLLKRIITNPEASI
jgi:hypothetical protein